MRLERGVDAVWEVDRVTHSATNASGDKIYRGLGELSASAMEEL